MWPIKSMLSTQKAVNLKLESMAEREGFEPPVPCGTPDFESGTFDHSATSPRVEFLSNSNQVATLLGSILGRND